MPECISRAKAGGKISVMHVHFEIYLSKTCWVYFDFYNVWYKIPALLENTGICFGNYFFATIGPTSITFLWSLD